MSRIRLPRVTERTSSSTTRVCLGCLKSIGRNDYNSHIKKCPKRLKRGGR